MDQDYPRHDASGPPACPLASDVNKPQNPLEAEHVVAGAGLPLHSNVADMTVKSSEPHIVTVAAECPSEQRMGTTTEESFSYDDMSEERFLKEQNTTSMASPCHQLDQDVVVMADNDKDFHFLVIQKPAEVSDHLKEGSPHRQLAHLIDHLHLTKRPTFDRAHHSPDTVSDDNDVGKIESSHGCQPLTHTPVVSSHSNSSNTTNLPGVAEENDNFSEMGKAMVIKGFNDNRCVKILHKVNSMRLMNHFGCDVVWIVNEEVLWAHSCVVSANSAVLDAMLKKTPLVHIDGHVESVRQLDIPCDSVQMAKDFLAYMYTGRLSATLDAVPGLLRLAQTLDIQDLRVTCVSALTGDINFLNWPMLLQAARICIMPELWKAVGQFFWNHLESLKSYAAFQQMSYGDFQSVLSWCTQDTQSHIEVAKLNAICFWVGMDDDQRNQHYNSLISLIDMEIVNPCDTNTQDLCKELNDSLLLHPKGKYLSGAIVKSLEESGIKHDRRKSAVVTRIPSKMVASPESDGYQDDGARDDHDDDPDYLLEGGDPQTPYLVDGVENHDGSQGSKELSSPTRRSKRRVASMRKRKIIPAKVTKPKSAAKKSKVIKKWRMKKYVDVQVEDEGKIETSEDQQVTTEASEFLDVDLEPGSASEDDCNNTNESDNEVVELDTEHSDTEKPIIMPEKAIRKRRKPRQKKQKQVGPFFCPHVGCTKVFRDRCSLRYHERSHNPGTPLLCDICGFTTQHPKSLQGHMGTHVGMRHKCDFPGCNFGCVGPGKLREHKNKHLGVRDSICHICGKTFLYHKHLQRHEKTHFPQEFHCCPICDFKNVRSDKLRVHIKGHHKSYALENGFIKPEDVEKYLQIPEKRRVVRRPPDPNAPPKKKRVRKKKESSAAADVVVTEAKEELQDVIQWGLTEHPSSTDTWGYPVSVAATMDVSALQPGWYSLPICTQQADAAGLTVEATQLQVPVAIYAEDNVAVFGEHV